MKTAPSARQLRYLENGATYWHLVDLLWLVLFGLLFSGNDNLTAFLDMAREDVEAQGLSVHEVLQWCKTGAVTERLDDVAMEAARRAVGGLTECTVEAVNNTFDEQVYLLTGYLPGLVLHEDRQFRLELQSTRVEFLIRHRYLPE